MHLEEIVFGKFENQSVQNKKTFRDILIDFATERPDFVPACTNERMSWSILVSQAVLVDFILQSVLFVQRKEQFQASL